MIFLSLSFNYIFCQALTTGSKNYSQKDADEQSDRNSLSFAQEQMDSVYNDSSITIGHPKFYADSHLLVGAELIDPFNPDESLVTATRLWKTDIRIGVSQEFKYGINSFVSIRDNDSPETNNFNLYEAGIKINHDWGELRFGQVRIQAGEQSFYLNEAFDRFFWDEGLIYDYLMRGIGTSLDFGIGDTELFIGSDKSSYFIGGGKYSIQPFEGLSACASGLYIARDQEYSAFGTQLGFELKESFKHFLGYQVIGYKNFEQSSSTLEEFTIFTEGRFIPDKRWNFSAAYFFKEVKYLWNKQDEIRASLDMRYKVTSCFTPELRSEIFQNAGFREIHLGFSAYLEYFKNIRIVPRIRYIITQFGPDIGYLGFEGSFTFGNKE